MITTKNPVGTILTNRVSCESEQHEYGYYGKFCSIFPNIQNINATNKTILFTIEIDSAYPLGQVNTGLRPLLKLKNSDNTLKRILTKGDNFFSTYETSLPSHNNVFIDGYYGAIFKKLVNPEGGWDTGYFTQAELRNIQNADNFLITYEYYNGQEVDQIQYESKIYLYPRVLEVSNDWRPPKLSESDINSLRDAYPEFDSYVKDVFSSLHNGNFPGKFRLDNGVIMQESLINCTVWDEEYREMNRCRTWYLRPKENKTIQFNLYEPSDSCSQDSDNCVHLIRSEVVIKNGDYLFEASGKIYTDQTNISEALISLSIFSKSHRLIGNDSKFKNVVKKNVFLHLRTNKNFHISIPLPNIEIYNTNNPVILNEYSTFLEEYAFFLEAEIIALRQGSIPEPIVRPATYVSQQGLTESNNLIQISKRGDYKYEKKLLQSRQRRYLNMHGISTQSETLFYVKFIGKRNNTWRGEFRTGLSGHFSFYRGTLEENQLYRMYIYKADRLSEFYTLDLLLVSQNNLNRYFIRHFAYNIPNCNIPGYSSYPNHCRIKQVGSNTQDQKGLYKIEIPIRPINGRLLFALIKDHEIKSYLKKETGNFNWDLTDKNIIKNLYYEENISYRTKFDSRIVALATPSSTTSTTSNRAYKLRIKFDNPLFFSGNQLFQYVEAELSYVKEAKLVHVRNAESPPQESNKITYRFKQSIDIASSSRWKVIFYKLHPNSPLHRQNLQMTNPERWRTKSIKYYFYLIPYDLSWAEFDLVKNSPNYNVYFGKKLIIGKIIALMVCEVGMRLVWTVVEIALQNAEIVMWT